MDIRAIERTQSDGVIYVDEVENDELIPIKEVEAKDRPWVIQCKRERRIGPTKIGKIVSTNLSNFTEKPYGYIPESALRE